MLSISHFVGNWHRLLDHRVQHGVLGNQVGGCWISRLAGADGAVHAGGAIRVKRGGRQSSLKALFAQGFVIEFANPKALLYFAAILPQFLNIDSAILPQILIMGLTTFLIDLTSYTAYAFLGDRLTQGGVKNWVVNLVNKCAGAALLYAGFRMAGVSVMR